jgi:hypothetical protein
VAASGGDHGGYPINFFTTGLLCGCTLFESGRRAKTPLYPPAPTKPATKVSPTGRPKLFSFGKEQKQLQQQQQ